jgi:hypothetical protein
LYVDRVLWQPVLAWDLRLLVIVWKRVDRGVHGDVDCHTSDLSWIVNAKTGYGLLVTVSRHYTTLYVCTKADDLVRVGSEPVMKQVT